MFKVIANRLEQGHKTSRYPQEAIELSRRFRGLPEIDAACDPALVRQCAESCPQQAILVDERRIDLGRCTFCGLCEQVSKGAFVRFTNRFELGAARREDLVTDGSLPELAAHAKGHFKRLFGRSLQLRQVSAGGCNGCEADTNVLNTPFFDLSRFGIDFVASPRHADGIHVTGPITRTSHASCCCMARPANVRSAACWSRKQPDCSNTSAPRHGSSTPLACRCPMMRRMITPKSRSCWS